MSIVVLDWRISVQIVVPHFFRLKRPDSALNAALRGVVPNKSGPVYSSLIAIPITYAKMESDVLIYDTLERKLSTP